MSQTEEIIDQLTDNGYDCAIAIATQEEVSSGAACGMLAILEDHLPVAE